MNHLASRSNAKYLIGRKLLQQTYVCRRFVHLPFFATSTFCIVVVYGSFVKFFLKEELTQGKSDVEEALKFLFLTLFTVCWNEISKKPSSHFSRPEKLVKQFLT